MQCAVASYRQPRRRALQAHTSAPCSRCSRPPKVVTPLKEDFRRPGTRTLASAKSSQIASRCGPRWRRGAYGCSLPATLLGQPARTAFTDDAPPSGGGRERVGRRGSGAHRLASAASRPGKACACLCLLPRPPAASIRSGGVPRQAADGCARVPRRCRHPTCPPAPAHLHVASRWPSGCFKRREVCRYTCMQVIVLDKELREGGNSARANSGINALTPGALKLCGHSRSVTWVWCLGLSCIDCGSMPGLAPATLHHCWCSAGSWLLAHHARQPAVCARSLPPPTAPSTCLAYSCR